MKRNWILLLAILIVAPHSVLHAQNTLDRISTVARKDGKGFVIRYHLDASLDSFIINQPSADLIQMGIYHSELDTANLKLPPEMPSFRDIELYKIPNGFGVDIHLGEEVYLEGTAYLDANGKDLLLGLKNSNKFRLNLIADRNDPIDWVQLSTPANALETDGSNIEYVYSKNKQRFDVVVLDAGHGEWEPGSIGHKGYKEKDITLAITKKLGKYIEENLPDVKVIYTRDSDKYLTLEERGQFANKVEGDLFISIHCNSFPQNKRVRGTEVYFLGSGKSQTAFDVMMRENSVVKFEDPNARVEIPEEELLIYELANSGYQATSQQLAVMIEDQFKNRAQRKSRGVKQAGFQVLYQASMPAVLVETGFISNPSELRFLTSDYGQSIIASAIYRAVRDYKVDYERSEAPAITSRSNKKE